MTVTVDLLREFFYYDDGKLYNKTNRGRALQGEEVGSLDKSTGYIVVRLQQTNYYVHRLIWTFFNEEIPNVIDHIDGDKTNNRIENLRNVTQVENQQNRKGTADADNTSGCRGVSYSTDRNKWEAYITVNKVRKALGRYLTYEEAVAARKAAEDVYWLEEGDT